MALLLGYGAAAINPYLAFDTIDDMIADGLLDGVTPRQAQPQLHQGVRQGRAQGHVEDGHLDGGLLHRRPGVRGHRPGPRASIDEYFTGTVSRIGGIGLDVLAAEVAARHRMAYPARPTELAHRDLEVGGEYQWRREGEYHLFNPEDRVQAAARHPRPSATRSSRSTPRRSTTSRPQLATLRGLLPAAGRRDERRRSRSTRSSRSSAIVPAFSTGAMSYGSISAEAHETLAIAMNRIGGRSNTGEGGEDADRFTPDANGDLRRSAIKQVASGRFGVTSEYLVNADDLQIKMAQGAKPGEGGQLAGQQGLPVDRQDPATRRRAWA